MVAVTAEALLDAPCPRAGITITGLGVGDSVVSVWRTADGERSPVRGARRALMVDSGFVQDYDVPLERPVTYEVEVLSGPGGAARVYAAPVTVSGLGSGWLMDPLLPQTAMPILGTRDQQGTPYLRTPALSELEYASDTSMIEIMGSDAPMALFGQVMRARGIPLHLSTRSAEQNTLLKELLTSTSQFVFRPTGYGVDLPGTMHILISSKKELPVDVSMGGSLTVWEMTADTVQAPVLKVLTATFTYGDVAMLFATYQQKQDAAAGKTYLDDLKSPLG